MTWATAGPTIGVKFLPGATVTEAIAYTAAGHIVADGADFGSTMFWSVAGSVSVTNAALGDDDLSVYFRQPEVGGATLAPVLKVPGFSACYHRQN